MAGKIPFKIINNLQHSNKAIHVHGRKGKTGTIEYGKEMDFKVGAYYKFAKDDTRPDYCFFEISRAGHLVFKTQDLDNWVVEIKRKKKAPPIDETVNITVGEDKPDT